MINNKPYRSGWKDYQSELKKKTTRKKMLKAFLKYFVLPLILILLLYFSVIKIINSSHRSFQKSDKNVAVEKKRLAKKDVLNLLNGEKLINLKQDKLYFTSDGIAMEAELTLDSNLQNFVLKKMKTSTSKYIGIVVMSPASGSVLTMASYNRPDPSSNPCTDITFPAASIFKIITAAAAVERCGFTLNTRCIYNGNKYTLYKSQLKNRTNKYSNKVKFKDAFAQSINPVFGKIGMHNLNNSILVEYAEAFGFNQQINFEIPLILSSFSLSDKPYNRAEIACGFNKQTMITPLHGALIISTILNRGKFVEPKIIEEIKESAGKSIYKNYASVSKQVITPGTAATISNLMKNTVRSGTCRKAFRGYRKDHVLSKLDIGGKTGSINNNKYHIRFDWFAGFAKEKKGREKIIISVLVAHEKYIGITASSYARSIMTKYFSEYFTSKQAEQKKT